jgi:hypothetical protein
MRGRGLVIAAAVLQLLGAALGLVTALAELAMASSARAPAGANHVFYAIAAVDLVIAAIMIPASIGLILRKRWGWWVSIGMMGLLGLLLLAMPLTGGKIGVGVGEMIIVYVLGAPIFVTIGLLVGGRRAVFTAPGA